MNLKNFFEAKSIAVIGASRKAHKVGHIILKNLSEIKYKVKVFAVNPKARRILGFKSFPSVKDIKEKIDLVIIATPAFTVHNILEECIEKGIKDIIIVSAGFGEVGNVEGEIRLKKLIKKEKLRVIGVNCLGILDTYSGIDTLFNPRERMGRPGKGGISFICQSGAVGSIMIDMMAQENYGLRRFISYGNATGLNESDFIEYLGKDKETKVISLYIEGVKDGKRFLNVCKEVSKKKPIVAIKAGITEKGTKAVKSHTGSLAGSGEIYKGVFRQAKIIQANTLEELFDFARILEKGKKPKGNKVAVITNGGGPAVITVDELSSKGLVLADFENKTKKILRKIMPQTVNVANPLDLVGDATDERFEIAIKTLMKDKKVDIILVILLPQTPAITENIINVLNKLYKKTKKPLCLIISGGKFSSKMRKELEKNIPTFSLPINAVSAIKCLVDYHLS